MNYWQTYRLIKDVFFIFSNLLIDFVYLLKFFSRKKYRLILNNNKQYRKQFIEQTWYILGNAPSTTVSDLKKLKNKNVICMNRAHLIKEYSLILPKFHILVDDKLYRGQWGTNMLNEIIKINPKVIFILNIKWYNNEYFIKNILNLIDPNQIIWIDTRKFINRLNFKFVKNDITKPTYGGGAFGSCLAFIDFCGFKELYIHGVDANGLCYELIDNKKSHIYGHNEENSNKSILDVCSDLDQMSITINSYFYWSIYFKKNNKKVFNTSTAGILNMFHRKKLI